MGPCPVEQRRLASGQNLEACQRLLLVLLNGRGWGIPLVCIMYGIPTLYYRFSSNTSAAAMLTPAWAHLPNVY